MSDYVLKISATDEKGLIYRISDVVFKYRLNIIKTDEFVDHQNSKFFTRLVLSGDVDISAFIGTLEAMLPNMANISMSQMRKKDIIIMATKEAHCLGDLLIRHHSGNLNANIKAIVSNHEVLRDLADKFNIKFHYISSENIQREEHEKKVLEALSSYEIDFLILAKYMRILSPNFVKVYPNQIINIHHSFLPAFIGANPYKQAYERGVKIVGATAHFVNNDLDEGPIITQGITRVDHEMSWQVMRKAGQNVEKVVLSDAVDIALEDRIFVNENKTIIF